MAQGPYDNIERMLPEAPMAPPPEGELDVELEGEEPEESSNFTIEEDEDGGVTITYGEDEEIDLSSLPFDANLAEVLDSSVLSELSSDLLTRIEEDDTSRADWKKAYEEGMTLLGLTYDERTEPFEGATGVIHPILNEAVTQFQAQAYKELLPAGGPARTAILGPRTPETEAQADRVRTFMNFQITQVMEEYDPDFDQMLLYVGYGGSAFKKVYFDGLLGRAVSPYVLPDDLIVPYSARDLLTAERVTHVIRISANDLKKQQVAGFYRDVDLGKPAETERDEIEEKIDKIRGVSPTGEAEEYVLYECHCNLVIEGEDSDIALPYIVTIEADNGKILSIRRNYDPNDPRRAKKQYFVHYKMMPGLGFYGFGLVHLLGNLSRAGTSLLRQLIDAGTLSNLPAGFKAKGLRIQDQESPLQPGEWRDVDAPGGSLRENLMPLPYKEPSATLFSLLGFCIAAAEKFIGTADLGMKDGNQELPVGTTIALLERGSRVMSAVHKRLHYAQMQELKLLARVFKETVVAYPYPQLGGVSPESFVRDFDDRIDVIPVSDPNIFSMTQRISLAQEQLRLAQAAPQMHNLYEAYRRMYSALGVQDIDMVLPLPPKPLPQGPAQENARSMVVPNGGSPLQAFLEQDHGAHIQAHVQFYMLPLIQASPQVQGVLLSHIFEHVSLLAQQQAMQQIQQPQQVIGMDGMPMLLPPAPVPPNVFQNIVAMLEAQLQAQVLQQLAPQQQGADPLVQLQQQNLMIKAKDAEMRNQTAQERLDFDRQKLAKKEELDRERLQSMEDIAQLRANVGLARIQGV
jgi:hypothetical protein